MSDIQVGDVVYLKSGGPAMTTSDWEGNVRLKCFWFVGGEIKSASINVDALTKDKPHSAH